MNRNQSTSQNTSTHRGAGRRNDRSTRALSTTSDDQDVPGAHSTTPPTVNPWGRRSVWQNVNAPPSVGTSMFSGPIPGGREEPDRPDLISATPANQVPSFNMASQYDEIFLTLRVNQDTSSVSEAAAIAVGNSFEPLVNISDEEMGFSSEENAAVKDMCLDLPPPTPVQAVETNTSNVNGRGSSAESTELMDMYDNPDLPQTPAVRPKTSNVDKKKNKKTKWKKVDIGSTTDKDGSTTDKDGYSSYSCKRY